MSTEQTAETYDALGTEDLRRLIDVQRRRRADAAKIVRDAQERILAMNVIVMERTKK